LRQASRNESIRLSSLLEIALSTGAQIAGTAAGVRAVCVGTLVVQSESADSVRCGKLFGTGQATSFVGVSDSLRVFIPAKIMISCSLREISRSAIHLEHSAPPSFSRRDIPFAIFSNRRASALSPIGRSRAVRRFVRAKAWRRLLRARTQRPRSICNGLGPDRLFGRYGRLHPGFVAGDRFRSLR
jgi:hypothetical protein